MKTRKKLFSIRMGFHKEAPPQIESLDERTRIRFHELFVGTMPEPKDRDSTWLAFFEDFFNYARNEIFLPDKSKLSPEREKEPELFFLNEDWNRVFDVIEWIEEICFEPMDDEDPDVQDIAMEHNRGVYFGKKYFLDEVNDILHQYNVGYSFIEGEFIPLNNKAERRAVQEALVSPSGKVRGHISKAIDSLDRNKPEYANCIKESIFAVEGILSEITGEREVDKACAWLKNQEVSLHPQFIQAIKNLYTFTSDAGGIRHSEKDDKKQDIDQDAAVCMLVTCSAIANYLAAKMPQLKKDESGKAADDDNMPF